MTDPHWGYDAISADRLTWHDTPIDAVHHDEATERMTWAVRVFRWDLLPPGVFDPERDGSDAQPGTVTFEGVEEREADASLLKSLSGQEVDWEVLEAQFDRFEGRLRCFFQLTVYRYQPEREQRYETFTVTCREARFIPTPLASL